LISALYYEPLTTRTLRLAASFWADARKHGKATASDQRLDTDVILAAQAHSIRVSDEDRVVVATTNVRHLGIFVDARIWSDILPTITSR
jgi:hypothetical protein